MSTTKAKGRQKGPKLYDTIFTTNINKRESLIRKFNFLVTIHAPSYLFIDVFLFYRTLLTEGRVQKKLLFVLVLLREKNPSARLNGIENLPDFLLDALHLNSLFAEPILDTRKLLHFTVGVLMDCL